jgi:hypothetical protein
MTIAWYDPTNHHVSTDKHDPLFTPLGQLWPLESDAMGKLQTQRNLIMTKQEALNLIKLLSALESWAFSTKTPFPDYLTEDLCVAVRKLEDIVLDKNA